MKSKSSRSFIVLALSTLLLSALSPAAQAADNGYRYWGYFQAAPGETSWSEAMTGPTTVVADGSVEGWVFTFSGNSVPQASQPMFTPNFSRLCGRAKFKSATQKRVGVVVDFGKAVLRPTGESIPHFVSKCVVIEKSALGSDILAKVVKIRFAASGFICAFNNYPAKECGAEIPTPRSLIVKKN
ncbi:MAG: SCO2322 family protein [Candidatus Nanopelagicaceae bacterium]|nr:SCO2322 family protein [Candidatus Nanopelagicaceae bacterium]